MNKVVITDVNEVLNKYIAGNVNGSGYQVPKENTPLCDIAIKYRVDKVQTIKHPFTHFYNDLLASQQNSIKKILQIGVEQKRPNSHSDNKTGASLYMWKDYFPRAQVYGAASDPLVMFRDRRITTVLADQGKTEDLEKLIRKTGSNIDLVIDDGTHKPEDQVATATTLMPRLKKDVLYIIEDVADESIQKYLKNYDTTLISLRNSSGKRYRDDKLLVVRNKGAWA